MSFWSGEKIAIRGLNEGVVSPFHSSAIDSAAYQLTLGGQAFVTTERAGIQEFFTRLIGKAGYFPGLQNLGSGDLVSIPPGQFAFLLTAEKVKIPPDALGFISVKARIKLRGLINVSGFHVDPGWDGNLIFAVFNAGAENLIFRRGEPLFLLFIADLDQSSQMVYQGVSSYNKIPTPMIQAMAGGVPSIQSLATEVEGLKNKVNNYTTVAAALGIGAGVVLAALSYFGSGLGKDSQTPQPLPTTTSASPQNCSMTVVSRTPQLAAKSSPNIKACPPEGQVRATTEK